MFNSTYTIPVSLGALLALLLTPALAFAQYSGGDNGLTTFAARIVVFINQILVPFVFTIALLLFIYGVYLYFFLNKGEGDNTKDGRQFMIWGVIAFVVMVSVWGIVNLLSGGLGLNDDSLDSTPDAGQLRSSSGGSSSR